jgi:flagellar hook-associated protein 3 FlgL
MLDTLNTEHSLKSEIMRSAFAKGLTIMDNEQESLNHSIADSASRYVRLQLTESRLSIEQTSFTELLSTNEDVDLPDTIVRFNSLQQVYNASLNAASKVVQNTLLDFL